MKTARDIRQEEIVRKWVKAGWNGTAVCFPGFGKTRVGIIAAKLFHRHNPNHNVLVLVPKKELVQQWEGAIYEAFEADCAFIKVITVQSCIRTFANVGFLIVDEVHRCASDQYRRIYDQVTYSALLQLTGTINRNDGLETFVLEKAPVIDTVSMEEMIEHDWISRSNHYIVLLDVEMNHYSQLNTAFLNHFSFFDYDLKLLMDCVRVPTVRRMFARKKHFTEEEIRIKAICGMRAMQARKKFIYQHPHKLETVKKILEHRPNSKAITFSKTVGFAKLIKPGLSVSSKMKPMERSKVMTAFRNGEIRVINTVDTVNEGFDDPDVNLIILASYSSSKIERIQRTARGLRKNEEKICESFQLVINNTQEIKWVKKSLDDLDCIWITEDQLDNVLAFKPYKIAAEYKIKEIKF
jgi:superfamily II DNA or RNA helicase